MSELTRTFVELTPPVTEEVDALLEGLLPFKYVAERVKGRHMAHTADIAKKHAELLKQVRACEYARRRADLILYERVEWLRARIPALIEACRTLGGVPVIDLTCTFIGRLDPLGIGDLFLFRDIQVFEPGCGSEVLRGLRQLAMIPAKVTDAESPSVWRGESSTGLFAAHITPERLKDEPRVRIYVRPIVANQG